MDELIDHVTLAGAAWSEVVSSLLLWHVGAQSLILSTSSCVSRSFVRS
jgi:hypothetical protein